MNRQLLTPSKLNLNSVDQEMVSLGDIVGLLLDRQHLIILSAAAAALAALIYLTSTVDRYTASSEIMLYPQRERVLSSEEIIPTLKPDDMLIATQLEIIESRSMAEMLVATFDLQNDPTWNGEVEVRTGLPLLIAELMGKSERREVVPEMKWMNAVEKMMAATSAEQVRSSLVISVRATAYTPSQSAELANALRDAYVGSEKLMSEESSSRASDWFQSRLDTLEAESREKERAVAQFRENNGLISAAGSTLTEQQVLDSQITVAAARSQLLEKEALLNQIVEASTSTDRLAEIGLAVGSVQVAELRRKSSELSSQKADLATRYGPKHPEFLRIEAEFESLNSQIKEELDRIIRATRDDVNLARSRLALAHGDRGQFEDKLAQNNSALVRLRELERDAAATKDVFDSYAKRFLEVSDQASLSRTPLRLVANAVPPARSNTPGLGLSLVAATFVGGLLGVGLALLHSVLDERVRTKADVDQRLGKPVYGIIPLLRQNSLKEVVRRFRQKEPLHLKSKNAKSPSQWALKNRFSRFGEAFRSTQTVIQFSSNKAQTQILVITSAVPSEGKTTIAICLARSIALSGKRTLLVDCDTRVRGVTSAFASATDGGVGLMETFSSKSPVSSFTTKDAQTPLYILGCTETDKHAEDIFSQSNLKSFFERASIDYDVIILDTPPVLALSDGVAIASQATHTLFVVRSGYLPSRLSLAGIRQIEDGGGQVAGVILNCVRADSLNLFSSGDGDFYKKIQRSYYTN